MTFFKRDLFGLSIYFAFEKLPDIHSYTEIVSPNRTENEVQHARQ
jgi:hypothetical protein